VDSAEKRIPELQETMEQNSVGYHSIHTAPARMEEAFISLINQLEIEEEL
jgi:hypothetical protein